jgi:hemolysin D
MSPGEVHVLPKPGNALKPVPARAAPALPLVADRAFLAAALEIVETPPSPIRIGLMLTICCFVAVALAWSWFGRLDILATARGKIEPVGSVKVVQPLETGRVRTIAVSDGQTVKAGDVLLVLDGREVQADLAQATADLTAAQAEALRRQMEIDAVHEGAAMRPAPIAWPATIPTATRQREQAELRGDLDELSATLANLDAQEAEKVAAVAQLDASIVADRALLPPLDERVALRRQLYTEGNGSKLNLLDAVQSDLESKSQVAGDVGKRAMAVAAIATLRTEHRKTIEAFLADQSRKLADARKTADEKAQDRAKALARLDHMTLTAPIAGTVQALAVTNPGQVVTVGQEVLRLVPSGGSIDIQAYVDNDDIGFVRPGQAATVKVDAFPFTRFGLLQAKVTRVAYDAIPADAADQGLDDATHAGDPSTRSMTPTSKPMTDLVFDTRLKLERRTVAVDGRRVALMPGMTVTVEIKTGSRRIIEYLFSPLLETTSKAMRER